MDILDVIIVALLLAIVYSFWKKYNEYFQIEKLENVQNNNIINEEDPVKKTKSVTKKIELLEDGAFSDVVLFRSIPIWGAKTGLQACMENCNGVCLDFGPTNDSMCFPRQ